MDLIPGWGRYPGGGHGNLLWCFCLENSVDKGAWQATVQSHTRMNNGACMHKENSTSKMKRKNILLALLQRKELGAVGCNVDPDRKCHIQ